MNSPPLQGSDSTKKAAGFAPEAFGRYFLVDRVAVGGMAEIFKAKTFGHGGFENTLVIKRILAHLSGNDQFVRMFMDEAKVSALLQHNNIVRIYDFGKIRENYFIAMEHVDGKDVKQILRKLAERRKILPVDFAVYVAQEAAKGLDYAHKRTTSQGQPLNIVHRDVSPSNILVSYNGEVRVADFGIVKAANCAETTGAGTLKGKFEYMSPEQASGKELDRRSDVFSLGIILWEMLTGRRLFKTDSDIKTLEMIKACEFEPPSVYNPQIPARLEEILLRALARDPDDRYPDARELSIDLQEFLYPARPDVTQQSLSHFLRELFTTDIEDERRRMEDGTRLAHALHESSGSVELEPEWEEPNGTRNTETGTPPPPVITPPRRSPMPALLAVGVGAVGLLLVGIALIFAISRDSTPEATPTPVATPAEPTGSLALTITPAAKVYLDGQLVGEGAAVELAEVKSGTAHVLRVEAEGYQPFEDKNVMVGEGVRLSRPITLEALPASRNERSSRDDKKQDPSAKTTVASFSSNPSGADVVINGRVVGKTPLQWSAQAGSSYTVEYRLSGYDNTQFSASIPEDGRAATFSRTLRSASSGSSGSTSGSSNSGTSSGGGSAAAPKEDGKILVTVRNGWGTVYIDGQKVGDAPKTFTVSAGKHTVRVVNEQTGLNETRTVDVSGGETERVSVGSN